VLSRYERHLKRVRREDIANVMKQGERNSGLQIVE
jgi:hypothetical protein